MFLDEITEVLDPEPHDGPLNMAIDEVLLKGARGPLLRVYRWARPAVSFGYFVRVAEVETAWSGRELVRRWTGGGVVPHGQDLTYTLVIPHGHPFLRVSARESYGEIHRRLAGWLAAVGKPATLAGAAAPKISANCFENPAEADLLIGDNKIAGAAQRRTAWGLLHQGSVQTTDLPMSLAAGLATSFARHSAARSLTAAELNAAAALREVKYACESWLRRF